MLCVFNNTHVGRLPLSEAYLRTKDLMSVEETLSNPSFLVSLTLY